MKKVYKQKNVFDAFQERLDYIFREFDNVCIAFSGGKDSGLLVALTMDYVKQHGLPAPAMMTLDAEAQYSLTTDYIQRTYERFPGEKFWCCLPMRRHTNLSNIAPYWTTWEPGVQWVRPMPEDAIHIGNYPVGLWHEGMGHREFYKKFWGWYRNHCGGGKTVGLLGIRADESLYRYNGIINKRCDYNGHKWLTNVSEDAWLAMPLYDWTTEDVWTANGRFGYDYNRIYDLYYRAGIPLKQMRVAAAFTTHGRASLKLYKILDPDMWDKLVERIPGVNAGSLYGDTKAMAYRDVHLPADHTWDSYARFLLQTLPVDMRNSYTEIFERRGIDAKRQCMYILRNDHKCHEQIEIKNKIVDKNKLHRWMKGED